MKNENDPIFLVDDDMVAAGKAVVMSIFPDADEEQAGTAAAGAFMAILSERENGSVLFAYQEDGPFFRFPTVAQRARQ